MDQTFKLFTDTATIAVFDPQAILKRTNDRVDWWCGELLNLEEVKNGTIAIVSLGVDGLSHARVTDGDLSADERDYAVEMVDKLGVVVKSGKLFIGPGECLPGGDIAFGSDHAERGALIEVANGEYHVEVYLIQWFDAPQWWTADDNPPDGVPVDYVISLKPRSQPIETIEESPEFDGFGDEFLFDSVTRVVGPKLGMLLTTKVSKGPRGLSLRSCGPANYEASLIDYSKVNWKDSIRLRVVAVDHENKTMKCEYLETVVAN